MRLIQCSVWLFLIPNVALCAVGDKIEPAEVYPGFGVFQATDAVMEVTETETGGQVDIVATGGSLPFFYLRWEHDGWSEIVFDAESTAPNSDIEFNPYGMVGSIRTSVNGRTTYRVPPSTRPFHYSFGVDLNPSVSCDFYEPACVGDLSVNYSLTESEPPLPGDFSFNDVVDFHDFLILSRHFGNTREDYTALDPVFQFGDANLDGVTDFTDFQILSDNFGATRQNVITAAIPEPTGESFALGAALSLTLLMHRHRASESREWRYC